MSRNYNKGYKSNRSDNRSDDLPTFKSSWISKEFGADTIEFAEKFGKYLVKERLTTSQIRNIYSEVKRIEAKLQGQAITGSNKSFLLLKPKIAYAAKRAGTRGIEAFKKVMDSAHTAVLSAEKKDEAFSNFVDFFEAILAYHKAFGGRE